MKIHQNVLKLTILLASLPVVIRLYPILQVVDVEEICIHADNDYTEKAPHCLFKYKLKLLLK